MAGVATCVALAAAERTLRIAAVPGYEHSAPDHAPKPAKERTMSDNEPNETIADDLTTYSVDDEDQLQPEDTLVSDDVEDALDRGYSPNDRAGRQPPPARPPTRSRSRRRSTSGSSRRSPTRTRPTAPRQRERPRRGDASAATTPTRSMPRTTGSGTTRSATSAPAGSWPTTRAPTTTTEKEAWARDVGIDGAAASAEEAAMHIIDEIATSPRNDPRGPARSRDH